MDSSTYTFDLSLLRSFVAVVDHGSFARAGQALGYTQAAVSQQMQRLEAQIGLPLFRRQGRNKHLTDSGMQLLRYAREMILLNDDAARALT
ncbi:LysR family transcriptional regulator, partial [Bordetella hinzii]|nr:LysR family transcriptional regulator [Bordetella hinzii]